MCKEHGFTHSIPIIKKDRSEDDKNDYNPTWIWTKWHCGNEKRTSVCD
jgi:hypothetical protein